MSLAEQSVRQYGDLLASDFPVPGGGSTAALNGALGCSFIAMIARITLKKPSFAARATRLREIVAQSEALRHALLALMDEDAEAYRRIMAARALPRTSETEQTARRETLRAALKDAAETPFRVLQAALAALILAKALSENYYPDTASDLALAALNLETAARGGYLTVQSNLNRISNASISAVNANGDNANIECRNCGAGGAQVNSNRADSVSSANVADAEYVLYYRRESERRLSEAESAAREIYQAAKTLLSRR